MILNPPLNSLMFRDLKNYIVNKISFPLSGRVQSEFKNPFISGQ